MTRFTSQLQDLHQESIYYLWLFFFHFKRISFSFLEKDACGGGEELRMTVFFIDLNECGLKPRPCEHRCMNSYGSYKCYCLNGYTLMPDGSCASE